MYYWAIRAGDEKSITKFDQRLYMPPKGVEAEQGPWTAAAEMQGFRGLASALNVKLTSADSPGEQVEEVA